MVGLHKIWISISVLFLLAACVPQAKQTSCAANEAYNSQLRSCVPVVQGPSAFINIKNPSPSFAVTKYKNSTDPANFSILVSNPYNQTHTVRWERTFNAGTPDVLGTNVSSISIIPNSLSAQVGIHIVAAKILDASGTVVDSHNFELVINELPQPTITTSTMLPVSPAVFNPQMSPKQFSFTVVRNSAILGSPQIRWSVVKDGVTTVHTETDPATSLSGGSYIAYLGTSTTPIFDPSIPTFGLGTYLVRAVLMNNAVAVDEVSWNVTVRHPNLGQVTGMSSPAPGIAITAQHGVDYNDFPTRSWVYSGSTKPGFCVTVNDADGTYSGDGHGVDVKWYLNALGSDICTKETDDAGLSTQTICLTDPGVLCKNGGSGVAFDVNLLKFSNASPSLPQNHSIAARVYDSFTGQEYAASNVTTAPNTYPLSWLVVNNPQNMAPVVGFGTTSATGCTSGGTYIRNNCAVNQGSTYTFGFTVADEFYSSTSESEQFQWDMKLRLGSSDVAGLTSLCSKSFGVAASPTYSTQYTCSVTIPHYGTAGVINPSAGLYSLQLSLSDLNSPVGGAGATSQPLTWNLNITETNPGATTITAQADNTGTSHVLWGGFGPVTVLDPAGLNTATEGDTIIFKPEITDLERDNFDVQISLCTSGVGTCTSSNPISPGFVNFLRSTLADPTLATAIVTAYPFPVPESLLISIGRDVNKTSPQMVRFKVDVTDIPSTPIARKTDVKYFDVWIINKNPAPVINTASASPVMGTPLTVYAGYPLSINPGTVSDTSDNSLENISQVKYQWYARQGAGAWAAITGADQKNISYTPENGAEAGGNISLMMCVGDRPAANPVDPANAGTPQCAGPWTIIPKDTMLAHATAGIAGNMANESASWYYKSAIVGEPDAAYTAYVDSTNAIYVEKSVFVSGSLSTSTIRKVSFPALASGVIHSVKDLSITGDRNNLYVAYLASTTSTPNNFVPRIRRIDTDFSAAVGEKTNLAKNKFGFGYTNYAVDVSSCTSCTYTPSPGDGTPARIAFSSGVANGQTITINGTVLTAVAVPSTAGQFCNSTNCPTASDAVADLVDEINKSVDLNLQGITARQNSTTLELYGSLRDDFLDFDSSIASVPAYTAIQLGKIFMNNGRWHMPMIISSTLDISIVSGVAGQHMRNSLPASINTSNLLGLGRSSIMDVGINSASELVIARVSAEASESGALYVHRFYYSGLNYVPVVASAPAVNPTHVFPTYFFEAVELATDTTGNAYTYLLAKRRSVDGGAYHVGRYSTTVTNASEDLLMNLLATSDATSTVISNTWMKKPELVAARNSAEARIFFNSNKGVGTDPSYPYVAKIRYNNTVSCGSCVSLTSGHAVRATAPIAVSVLTPDLVLGSNGTALGENTKDIVLGLFNIETSGPTYRPRVGILNIESENISATTYGPLFRSGYVKD